ncbi:MAG: helix-turn-helix domain-containing protein [Lactobacillus sp.]|nr:helix-turn-helix domain-containing protein [Lactobacillus sp.]MCH4067978.1 helix-turn-helix domain-containing protein [Lactobacillus sp.]MCI1304066.1 helix-turn-helix domain-containing protein [Lactobacillus sp.]MCI1329908.1 helix-turn-helix domain-containing protein [Lactobacillus sp.]MCI1399508.1 helix-turn-helix domain-containing protein [Lactobacillus sp.]
MDKQNETFQKPRNKDGTLKPSYYSITPASVRYAKINPGAKLLYGEITALSNSEGYCWAANAYFAKLYDTDKSTIKRWLRQLEELGVLSSVVLRGDNKQVIQRRLFINDTPGVKNAPTPGCKNKPTPGVKNEPENITRKNTTSNINTLSLTPSLPGLSTGSKPTNQTKQKKREIKNKPLTDQQTETVKMVRNLFAQWGITLSEYENGMLCYWAQHYQGRTIYQNAQSALGRADDSPFWYLATLMKQEKKDT